MSIFTSGPTYCLQGAGVSYLTIPNVRTACGGNLDGELYGNGVWRHVDAGSCIGYGPNVTLTIEERY